MNMISQALKQKREVSILRKRPGMHTAALRAQIAVCTILNAALQYKKFQGCQYDEKLVANSDLIILKRDVLRGRGKWNMYEIYKNEIALFSAMQDELKQFMSGSGTSPRTGTDVKCSTVAQWTQYGNIRFADVIGLEEAKTNFKQSLIYPIIYPNLFPEAVHGILLYGPPGVGKTFIMKAIVNELLDLGQDHGIRVIMFNPTGAELKGKYVGETEKNIKKYFTCAQRAADACGAAGHYVVSIIFIDEVDSIARSRASDETGLAASSVNALLQAMDGIVGYPNVYVVGATNYPWQLDSAVLRRFKSRIYVQSAETALDKYNLISNLINRYLEFHLKDHIGPAVNKTNKKECDKYQFGDASGNPEWVCARDTVPSLEGIYKHDWEISPYIDRLQLNSQLLYKFLESDGLRLMSNSDLDNVFKKVTRAMAKDALGRRVFQAEMYPVSRRTVGKYKTLDNDFLLISPDTYVYKNENGKYVTYDGQEVATDGPIKAYYDIVYIALRKPSKPHPVLERALAFRDWNVLYGVKSPVAQGERIDGLVHIGDSQKGIDDTYVDTRFVPSSAFKGDSIQVFLRSMFGDLDGWGSYVRVSRNDNVGIELDGLVLKYEVGGTTYYFVFKDFEFGRNIEKDKLTWKEWFVNYQFVPFKGKVKIDWGVYIDAMLTRLGRKDLGKQDILAAYADVIYKVVGREVERFDVTNKSELYADDINMFVLDNVAFRKVENVVIDKKERSDESSKVWQTYGLPVISSENNIKINSRLRTYDFNITYFEDAVNPSKSGFISGSLVESELKDLKEYSLTGKAP